MQTRNLIHFGCSYAIGNGVPEYIPDLPLKIAHMAHKDKEYTLKKYKFEAKTPYPCGNYIADKLGFNFKREAQNGSSNERIFRKLLETNLRNARVLIGLTSDNRREGLTTRKKNSHWHTWKIVERGMPTKHKDQVFDPWGEEYIPAILEECQIKTIIQIIYMQSFLKTENIPYLMFNAMWNGFDQPKTTECKDLLNNVDENHFYNLRGTFDECQHGWCIKEKLHVSDADEHPNLQGQLAWGEKLLPMAQKILINNNND